MKIRECAVFNLVAENLKIVQPARQFANNILVRKLTASPGLGEAVFYSYRKSRTKLARPTCFRRIRRVFPSLPPGEIQIIQNFPYLFLYGEILPKKGIRLRGEHALQVRTHSRRQDKAVCAETMLELTPVFSPLFRGGWRNRWRFRRTDK